MGSSPINQTHLMIRGIRVVNTDHMLLMIVTGKTCEVAMKSIGDGIFSGWEGHEWRTVICTNFVRFKIIRRRCRIYN